MKPLRILAHIVLYRSPQIVRLAIQSLLEQQQHGCEFELTIVVSDNASGDGLIDALEQEFSGLVSFNRNQANLGFAAAQNWAAALVLKENFDYFFLVNPDSRFEKNALAHLLLALEQDVTGGAATPLLYRAQQDLSPVTPHQIDAAGISMSRSLRHFDREEIPQDSTDTHEYVFGGTGAALLLKRACIESLILDTLELNQALYDIYPQLQAGAPMRAQLFDESFFAFREDADLAWRSQLLGWRTIFVVQAVGYHVRHVLPERRSQLSPLINKWSVRNRFLMQVNNFHFKGMAHCIFPGLIIRNAVVLLGVVLTEWSSIAGIKEFFTLLPRALARRRKLSAQATFDASKVAGWFH